MSKCKRKRKKAFLGAAIGLAANVVSGIVQKNKEKNIQREQAKAKNRADTFSMANELTNAYADRDYVDDYNNRVVMKCGGSKKMRCGGLMARHISTKYKRK